MLFAACDSGSEPASTSDSASVESALTDRMASAARYRQPRLILDHAEPGSALERLGGLLFDRSGPGYVEDGDWCLTGPALCVAIDGDGDSDLSFGGIAFEDYVLDAEHSAIGDTDLEVIDVRALQHPVSGELKLWLDVRSDSQWWSTLYDRPSLTIGGVEHSVYLDGPESTRPQVVTRYSLVGSSLELDGDAEMVVRFSDGVQDSAFVDVTISIADPDLAVERRESPIDANPPVALYRNTEPIDDDSTENGEGDSAEGDQVEGDQLDALIEAIIEGSDPSELVVEGSPAAVAVSVLGNDAVQGARRDPDGIGVCLTLVSRGPFCERWHTPVLEGGVLSSWSIEGQSVGDLTEERSGSFQGASSTWFRFPLGGVVVGVVEVRNNTASQLPITLSGAAVVVDDLSVSALSSIGEYVVEASTTETGFVVVDANDFSFDVWYPVGRQFDGDPLEFRVAGAEPINSFGDEDLDAAAVRLASFIGARRFAEATELAAPGSDADAYLTTLESVASDSRWFFRDDESAAVSPTFCVWSAESLVCVEVAVTELDDEGLIAAMEIDGIDVAELVVGDLSSESDVITLEIDAAIVIPGVGTTVRWEVANDSASPVVVERLVAVSPDGLETEAKRSSLFEEVLSGRTIARTSTFDADVFDGVIEVGGTGRESVRSFSTFVVLGEAPAGLESVVEGEAESTDIESRGGTVYSIPGQWGQIVYFDEDTNQLAGIGTALGAPKSVGRLGSQILTFSPERSPSDFTADELVQELGEYFEISESEVTPGLDFDGNPIDLVSGQVGGGDFVTFGVIPAESELFVVLIGDEIDEVLIDVIEELVTVSGTTEL